MPRNHSAFYLFNICQLVGYRSLVSIQFSLILWSSSSFICKWYPYFFIRIFIHVFFSSSFLYLFLRDSIATVVCYLVWHLAMLFTRWQCVSRTLYQWHRPMVVWNFNKEIIIFTLSIFELVTFQRMVCHTWTLSARDQYWALQQGFSTV